MTLHLNEDKDQNVVFGSSFLSNPVFEKRRGEKGDKRLGLGKYQLLGGVSSHFLLLMIKQLRSGDLKRLRG